MDMIEEPTHGNRRRTYRAEVHGCAIVHAGESALRCAVVDLGLGGVRLLEPMRDETGFDPGTEVIVELECAGAGWVVQPGRVGRHGDGEIAVIFGALEPEVEDLIEDEVLGAVEAARAPRVVVVDRCAERRRDVATALRDAGCCVLEAATPLEAIELIERSRNHVAGVAVAGALTQTQSDELLGFLAEDHPQVHVTRLAEVPREAEIVELAARVKRS